MTDDPQEELFSAISEDEATTVSALLDEQPERMAARDPQGVSVLLAARYAAAEKVVQALRPRVRALDVYEAAAYAEQAWLQSHLQRDPTLVESFSPDGWTPLHLAAQYAPAPFVRYLLQARAPVNAVSKNPLEMRALHSSAARGDLDAATALLQAGAEVDAVQIGGWTALHLAAHLGLEPMIDLLLRHGASPTAQSEDEKTPGDLALAAGHEALARRLGCTAPPPEPESPGDPEAAPSVS